MQSLPTGRCALCMSELCVPRPTELALRRRYERSKDRSPQGSSVVQRHVAQPADIRDHEGKGVLVQLKDMDNANVLGQQPRQSDMYL